MTAKSTKTIDQVVAQTINTVTAAAVAQGFIPEQQAADAWAISFDNIAHVPDLNTLSDDAFFAAEQTYGRYLYSKALLRDGDDKLNAEQRERLTDIVQRYEVYGHDMVENTYRASLVSAVLGGAALTSAAAIAAEAFVIGLTGSTLLGSVASIGLIFATAFAVFKFGDQMLSVLRWVADHLAAAVGTVCDWISAGWNMLTDLVSNALPK